MPDRTEVEGPVDDRPDRGVAAVSVPMDSGSGMGPTMGVAAPVGAVSRRTRERAGRTSLRQEGTSGVVLLTGLPGSVSLQRRGADGTWETLARRPASRLGRTRLPLPDEGAAPPATFRVVFSPRNPHLPAWVSGDVAR